MRCPVLPWTMQPFLGRLWQMTQGSRQVEGRQASRLLKRSSSGVSSWLQPPEEVEGCDEVGWELVTEPQAEGTSSLAAVKECEHLPSGMSTPSSVSGRGLEAFEASSLSSEATLRSVVMLVSSVVFCVLIEVFSLWGCVSGSQPGRTCQQLLQCRGRGGLSWSHLAHFQ